jgi:radical SAM superfamily enzyme YgiQ (UPF0313 family)
MRVLLVSANRERIPDPIFPLGLAYVAAAAREAGHEVAVADLCFDPAPLQALTEKVRQFDPDLIGLSLRNVDNAAYPRTVDYLDQHRAVVDTLHRTTTAPVVLGGSGFSIMPAAYMRALDGDWGITGEAEIAFVALLEALQDSRTPDGIAGLYGRDGFVGCSTDSAPAPVRHRGWANGLWPARDLLDYPRYIRRGGVGNIQTKRGCVFKCRYCTYPLLEGNRFRTREAADVVDEIAALMKDYGPHPIFFVDSILNFPRGHVEAICEEILRRGLKVRWSCYATPVKLDRHQAQLMAAAGCDGIELGTDAVDDEQLVRLGKSFDAEVAERTNRYCLEAGLRVCQTLIFGAPGETRASIRATCAALRRMNPTAVVAMTGVRLYPGTPLTNSLINEGRIAAGAIGLLPAFYVEPAVADFLPDYLQQQAYEAGNWVLPGLAAPILPASQRLLRALGVSGPLWRLLQNRWMHVINRTRFRHPNTSWGVPHPRRKVV